MSNRRREIIVEVGLGEAPAWGKSDKVRGRIESGKALYIGIDSSSDVDTEMGSFCYGKLGELPISDGVVDQLWVWNVFGSEREKEMGYPARENGKYVIRGEGEKNFFDLARITREGGKIIIAEDNTPASWLA